MLLPLPPDKDHLFNPGPYSIGQRLQCRLMLCLYRPVAITRIRLLFCQSNLVIFDILYKCIKLFYVFLMYLFINLTFVYLVCMNTNMLVSY